MKDARLREVLEELHLELLQFAPDTAQMQKKRDDLAAQIRDTLEQPDLGGYHVSLKDTLDSELVSFEDAHPKMAQLMKSVVDTLGSFGV